MNISEFCSHRVWKQAKNTFDTSLKLLCCYEKLIDGKCPKHGTDIIDISSTEFTAEINKMNKGLSCH